MHRKQAIASLNDKGDAAEALVTCRLANKESPDGSLVVIIDYTGWRLKKSAPMKVSMAVLKML
jgi:hypothetical protein